MINFVFKTLRLLIPLALVIASLGLMFGGNFMAGILLFVSGIVVSPLLDNSFDKATETAFKSGQRASPRGGQYLLGMIIFGVAIWAISPKPSKPSPPDVSEIASKAKEPDSLKMKSHENYRLSEREKAAISSLLEDEIVITSTKGEVAFAELTQEILGDYVIATSAEVQKEYERNEVAGDLKYGKKLIFLTGTVRSIDRSIGENYFVGLNGGSNMFINPKAQMADGYTDFLANLEKGESVSLVCSGSGMLMGSAIVSNCEPVRSYGHKKAKWFTQKFDLTDWASDKNLIRLAVFGVAVSNSLRADSTCFDEFATRTCQTEFKGLTQSEKFGQALLRASLKVITVGLPADSSCFTEQDLKVSASCSADIRKLSPSDKEKLAAFWDPLISKLELRKNKSRSKQ